MEGALGIQVSESLIHHANRSGPNFAMQAMRCKARMALIVLERTVPKISWAELDNVQESGSYPFRDGVVTVLELEIAIWRSHPNALFRLMKKNPVRDQVEYVLGNYELPADDAA
jgi:hypothetical protein